MKKSRLTVALISILIGVNSVRAQSLESSFEFLRLPVSAHSSSLGGHAVSVYDPDPVLFISNPALLSATGNRYLGLNTMTWFAGTTVAGAQYISSFDDRSHYAFNARYVNYGKMKETSADGTVTGRFSAKDIALGVTWSYLLTDNLSGGATAHIISSRYGSMTSVAIGIDLGLLWFSDDRGLSVGLAATSLGGQIKAFENTFQKLPFDLGAGITWAPEHAPLRFTLSMDNLTRWSRRDFYFDDDDDKGFGEILRRHISIGADIYPTEHLYIALGCNLRKRAEMSVNGSRGFTGMTIGTGLRLGRVMFDISYGKYQVSESSLICNFGFNI